ncbi:glycosyltransferase family 4 protein [Methylomonas sp. LL1]|uniref:glycosyltransferase family 4 protein n=1 Tax=Methylomonas sp. LL1 TaxID=2785785 RepID=UPI0018C366E8|nr:glycosyltransferase family 4 protein [Methylomonas sp. LL1]QPK64912.1 glycosyltransferase family 4 protein [Methylomonas sp. LL1]
MRPRLLFLITEDWFFCSHFLARAMAARDAGYDVLVVARERDKADLVRAQDMKFIALEFSRKSLNPLSELRVFLAILEIYRREKPTLVHHIASKPILYGSLAALLTGIRGIVNAPVGMGYVFSSNDLKARLLRPFLKFGYRLLINPRGSKVIFENQDDLGSFVQEGAVRPEDAVLIKGAGVDLSEFHPSTKTTGEVVVVLVARMLKDKGIMEFIEAARILKQRGVVARFVLVGDIDQHNHAAIDKSVLLQWSAQGVVDWWGHRSDIPEVLQQADIACLPSYREGLPKALLEAMAAGLPCVATDVPGCREAVRDGENGLLVPVRNPEALALALEQLIADPRLMHRLGQRGRQRIEQEFSTEHVVAKTLSLYKEMLG